MKKYLSIVLLVLTVGLHAQPLRDVNYAYQYDPDGALVFELKGVRVDGSYLILYNLQVRDTAALMSDYTIQWEGRSMLSDKEGTGMALDKQTIARTRGGLRGRGVISAEVAPRYLVAKVIRNSARRAWLYYTALEPNLPVNNFLTRAEAVVVEPYISTDETVRLGVDSGQWVVSYYDDNFPPAAPAFSEALARVPRTMRIDSTYTIAPGQGLQFARKGLYLIQKDTSSQEAFAFRAEDDYPRYSKLANLAGPLIYICTRQEYDRLEASQGNKKAFDRVILNITADTERARTLMRNYFRRVELANRLFTSYKEGWKTDRGMIYIIFGVPDEVLRFHDREVWNYKNDKFNERFTFSRSSSLFDPDNFVLIREKKYENTWYEVIDLWRNARF